MKLNKVFTLIVVGLVVTISYYSMAILITNKIEREKTDLILKEEIRDNFVQACIDEYPDYSYCNCSFDYIYDKVGVAGLFELEDEIVNSDELPKIIKEAINKCLN